MADRTALGMIGLMLGAATVFVTVTGAIVVGGYSGPLDARNVAPAVASSSVAAR